LGFDQLAEFSLGAGRDVVEAFRVGGGFFQRRLRQIVLQRNIYEAFRRYEIRFNQYLTVFKGD